MNKTRIPLLLILLAATLQPATAATTGEVLTDGPAQNTLSSEIALREERAFHRCGIRELGREHSRYFSTNAEFYVQGRGLLSSDQMVEMNHSPLCLDTFRELVAGTFQVHAVGDSSALSQGVYRFCRYRTGKCAQTETRYVVIWRLEDKEWLATRVLIYEHHAITSPG